MAVVTGKIGSLTFASGYASHCNSWTVDFATDIFEDTEMGDSWRTKVVGVNDWSGSFDCALDEATLTTIGELGIGAPTTAAAAATFKYSSTGTIVGDIIITGSSLNTTTAGVNTITFTFLGSGKPTVSGG